MTSFAALHVPGRPLLLPNAWEFGFAAALAGAGHPAVGTTSLGVSAAAGLADGAPESRAATVALAKSLAPLDILVSVDLADGFSADPGAVADLVAELADAGVAGINLEDGRADVLAPAVVQTALLAKVRERVPGMFLNARTDTHWLGTGPVADAITRARAYADAGADCVFVPGLHEPADVAELAEAVEVPVNLLHLPGKTTFSELASLGVARVSLGSTPYRVALSAALSTVDSVREGAELPMKPPSYGDVTALLP
ncbi:isocitrate lyase/phosphoenolpyruvate mutase family protein [Amycolatopsis rubida]|uniref:2-Methylisocitrate lyase, PEP mutase family n=1 Tax=Amycolatopsis rubida TaxID=112413 RepID=A0A1I5KPG5_9PSEU|nr:MULTISPECIES: isocitrate lyase/phosphoenolpyruvate mutase family protein [Amycolatopsis]MYW90299.1 isocitrate lyase/phosphoenolpyruvate mutase family protein [Amycolatopsis rubida]NEC55276.1 isocitrate lyase/phosphoenolpyruvate mutase family protein [Amycolatopsis rubida]OAP21935.1 Carboxyvinyl-carboxyphosphonate phosphorylmutase [Amycolatopsis sp. M39]SFO86905.1 2-Methylisocitrate lyase, PEP mutase family [Amycolatopsis rubida]